MVRSPADLFHLDPDALLELERWGEKSVDNLMRDLEERRRVPFGRYLVALAIPEVGTATAKLLARHFSTREELAAATAEERLTWPEGSSEAYVTHVGTIDGRSGFSRRPSLLRRAWSALAR